MALDLVNALKFHLIRSLAVGFNDVYYTHRVAKDKNRGKVLKDIRNIEWGNDSAENDPDLLTYFVIPSNFDRIAEFKKTFVIGRKGAGKTAIRKN